MKDIILGFFGCVLILLVTPMGWIGLLILAMIFKGLTGRC